MAEGINGPYDISLRVKARGDKVVVVWKCPRCGWRNEEVVGEEFSSYLDLSCGNPCCGQRNVYVTVYLNADGSYQDQTDTGYIRVDFSDTVTCPACGKQTPRGYDDCFECEKRLP